MVITFTVATLAWVFFRSPNIHIAGEMLSRMLAFNGFSLPDQFFAHGAFRDKFLSGIGFQFVDTSRLDIKHYGNALANIVILLTICWAMPNTQQLLSRYNPILEPVARPSWIHLKLGFWLALLFGFLGYLILRNSYVSEPSPFIYFNF